MDSIIPQDATPLKRCPKCPEGQQWHPATAEYFASQKTSKDKLYSWCRRCTHQDYIEHKEERKRREALRKEEISQYQKAYRAEHKEEKQEYNRLYHTMHEEEIRQQRYQYRTQHREELRKKSYQFRLEHKEYYTQYNHRYFAEHKEEICQQGSQYRAEHREKYLQYQHQYRATHKEEKYEWYKWYRQTERGRIIRRANEHKRRAIKKNVEGTYTSAQIQEQLKRQKYCCYYAACGFSKFKKVQGKHVYEIEHTFPLTRVAGSNIPANSISYLVLSCKSCNSKKHNKFPWEWFEGGRLL